MDNSNSILNILLNYLPHAIFWKDKNLIFQGCNLTFAKQFGFNSIDELIGKSDYDFNFSPELIEKYRKDDLEVIEQGITKVNYEEIQHQDDGSQKILLVSKLPFYDKNNQILGILGIYTDISELKLKKIELNKAREKSEAANRAKDEFIRNMSHDIRTPLSGIIGMSSILEQTVLNQEAKEHAHMINVSGEQLLTLLNSVLDIIATGSQQENQVNLAQVNCRELIQNIANLELPTITLKKLSLLLKISDNLPVLIESDPIKIHRILLNLLGNSVKFTNKGSIEIGARLAGDKTNPCVEFYIQDSGIGIEPDNLDKIFKKFFRGTTSYQGLYAGHGVGLHIVKRYTQLLKGDIQVTSTPGEGTRFTVTIPAKIISPAPDIKKTTLAQMTSQASSHTPSAQTKLNIKVLLVEDNAIALQMTIALLQQLGMDYKTAINGQQAIECFKQQEFDFILSDIGLPDISGLEVTRRIRAFEQENGRKPTPIFGLTAHSIINVEPEGLQAGMNRVLSKPLRSDMLLAFLTSNLSADEHPQKAAEEALLIDEGEAIRILGCRETMLSIWADFVTQSQKDIEELEAAWAIKDFATVQNLAHKMKSSALYCGAVQMRDACQAMEYHFKHQAHNNPNQLYEQLCVIVKKTIEAMKALVD